MYFVHAVSTLLELIIMSLGKDVQQYDEYHPTAVL